ncbi:MAG: alpha/beta hydrolase [Polyangiaceae bacterium]
MIKAALPHALRALLSLPPSILTRAAGGPVERDGQTLDAQLGAILAGMRLLGMRESGDVAKSRRVMDREVVLVAPARIDMETAEYRIATPDGPIASRFYRPSTAREKPPLLVFYHGGGFVLGGLESHDLAVREVAHRLGAAVLAIDYRLAPEHKAPAAIEDAYHAYTWARAHASELSVDADRIGVGGDSAGGNLSAALTHVLKDRGGVQPVVQWLVYPATDLTRSFPSHRLFPSGFLLEDERIEWFLRHYTRSDADRSDPLLSPHFRTDFAGLAPAVILTAGFDPLRDEGRAYADRLAAAGVPVDYTCARSLIHGFLSMTGAVNAAREAIYADLERVRARLF